MRLGFTGVMGLGILLLLGAAGFYIFYNRKTIITAINPADANNLANKAVNAAVSNITGRDETFGGLIYDTFHSSVNPPVTPITSIESAPIDQPTGIF